MIEQKPTTLWVWNCCRQLLCWHYHLNNFYFQCWKRIHILPSDETTIALRKYIYFEEVHTTQTMPWRHVHVMEWLFQNNQQRGLHIKSIALSQKWNMYISVFFIFFLIYLFILQMYMCISQKCNKRPDKRTNLSLVFAPICPHADNFSSLKNHTQMNKLESCRAAWWFSG